MNKKLISLVVGARPNFMKIAPIVRALKNNSDNFSYRIIHTGQHNNKEMNDVFFRELEIPPPDVYLKGNGGTHSEQTARIMIGFEQECVKSKPDIVLVVGDINSSMACAIVTKKMHIKLIHVEAGLRSGDREMPEEINRILIDSISDLLFVTEPTGLENLLFEGHSPDEIHYVGNVMIDNLFYQLKKMDNYDFSSLMSHSLKSSLDRYGVFTIHRPSNVDSYKVLERIIKSINEVSKILPIIFPVHPRTRLNIEKWKIKFDSNVHLITSLPYMEFLSVWKDSALVMTDSGGLQEETTALGVPCITLRNNTERPITLELGTNHLVGSPPVGLLKLVNDILIDTKNNITLPKYWDGKSADRIVQILVRN
ncbi:UDP-N-acetylglucosamine 2-epimerase (non-hydrolyzing) [Candidatus Thioglobus sp.]|nr:UDP-N-acetylglucosamine 2-epimerase (non-hydrolyzing) [Candidatus Thioglobus sp.]